MAEQMLIDRRLDEFEQDLSIRVLNALRNDSIETVEDLVRHTETELLRIPNLGRRGMDQIKEFLVARGLRLGMDFLRRRQAVIKGLNERDQRLIEGDALRVCLQSVRDHVEAGLSMRRIATLNRKEQTEHHSEVLRARMNEIDYIVRSWAMDRGREV